MLTDHRRTLWYTVAIFGATAVVFILVAVHATQGLDDAVDRWMQGIHSTPLTWLAKGMNVIGGTWVTLPLRIVVAAVLLWKRGWRKLATWLTTWVLSETAITVVKALYARPRPLDPLVATTGHSFPSGHAVAASATAVALVLVILPPGSRRRKWELLAVLFAFAMAFSRVYLNAHWLTDVIAGTLLGTGIALGSAALVTEIRDVAMRRMARRTEAGRAGEP